uniref:Uncharacterized protein n=1 Tax=Physcomitrium patens TaxID=3218 RepID=A0A7I4BRK3_PHYPA
MRHSTTLVSEEILCKAMYLIIFRYVLDWLCSWTQVVAVWECVRAIALWECVRAIALLFDLVNATVVRSQANKLESRLELVYGFRQGAGIAMK